MASEPYIPQKTIDRLNSPPVKGQRHDEIVKIAVSLVGSQLPGSEIFTKVRAAFPPDVTDAEIAGVINWARTRNIAPPGNSAKGVLPRFDSRTVTGPPPEIKPRPAGEQAHWWLSGTEMTQEEFASKSQLPVPDDRREALTLFLEQLYLGTDHVNLVLNFTPEGGKAKPTGGGKILTRDEWVSWLMQNAFPESKAGGWFRLNPTKAAGSGSGGAVTDSDITSHRFLLVESDSLPIGQQLALFSRLKLPIAAVYMSGGISAHALVRMDAANEEEFSRRAVKILAALKPFGIDQANKNPSRLSRLPGAIRIIGGVNGGLQKLLWLNPAAAAVTDDGIKAFQESLLMPAIDEVPFKTAILDSMPRYQDLYENQGKSGVMTGFQKFDSVSGGLKPGGYTLIAAATGVGKTTIAMNIMNTAIKAGHGTALFSLEMTRDDIVDMMFSLNCRIDRNKFNTGAFTEGDLKAMIVGCSHMKNLPLWVFDDPAASMEAIRKRVLSLKAAGKISLVVIDYAQLTIADGKPESREQAVGNIALGVRLLSREANVPVILLSQLNDDGKVRESRKLAHEAANVFVLKRDSAALTDPNMTLYVEKGRKIPSDPIPLYLEAEYCLITERGPISRSDLPRH